MFGNDVFGNMSGIVDMEAGGFELELKWNGLICPLSISSASV